MRAKTLIIVFLYLVAVCSGQIGVASENRITILYEAFGTPLSMTTDWGFAAFIEFEGKHILFDTGNDAGIFEHNAKTAEIDLRRLDFVAVSHRHGDHTTGLNYLLKINPEVTVYIPNEKLGPFKSGSSANFVRLDTLTEVAKGVYLIPTKSRTPKLQELSLALQTSEGLVLVVGCSHPGIETIVDAASAIDERIYNIFGGFHLLSTPRTDIERLANSLINKWHVQNIAPGHCTGEQASKHFLNVFGKRYSFAGLGTVTDLP